MSCNTKVVEFSPELRISREGLEFSSALNAIYAGIDTGRGALFSSGFDYPGRHSRWDIGFLNPALEFSSRKRQFFIRPLNDQGNAVLERLKPLIESHPHVSSFAIVGNESISEVRGEIVAPSRNCAEEERSRQPSVFTLLRSMLSCLRSEIAGLSHEAEEAISKLGFFGAFGYDLIFQFEDIELRQSRSDEQYDCRLFLPLEVVVVDRKKEVAERFSYDLLTPLGWTSAFAAGGEVFNPIFGQSADIEVLTDHTPGEFAAKVEKIVEGTKRGDYFEVVLSQTFSVGFSERPTKLLKRLSALNPSPYMFLLNFADEQLVGASPEIYVRITGRRYETCPIAGTIRRGKDALEDADRVRTLIGSEKDEAELTMCTDVDRNDMARVCDPGSVKVIGRRQLEFYSHLIHTVDHLEGTISEGYDSLDAFQSHMWACTVTGAPKPAALQEIENLENSPRGYYSGAVGFIGVNGDINTGITLRTARLAEGRASIRAGATLLYGSVPQAEEAETRTKAAAFLKALTTLQEEPTAVVVAQPKYVIGNEPLGKTVFLVDCRDSFVHNLASYLRAMGANVVTYRVGFSESELSRVKPDLVFLSPGPAAPEDFGIPSLVGRLVDKDYSIFGVCLGHQGIGQHFGARLGRLPLPVHGRPALVTHNGNQLFAGVPEKFEAGRYHSLYLERACLPECLEITADADIDSRFGADPERVIMAIRHKSLPIASVQFHPESLMTLKDQAGYRLLYNAVRQLTERQ
ncbi:MAG: anthranilate synthase component I [bacterium]|nr:anthranilate synthase component I [bacterium]